MHLRCDQRLQKNNSLQYNVATELAELTNKCAKFNWKSETLKMELANQVMLMYSDSTKPFNIFTDASKLRLGAVISQDNQPLAFCLCKLSDAQTRYTVIKQELLNIYTDHKNLKFNHFSMDRACEG